MDYIDYHDKFSPFPKTFHENNIDLVDNILLPRTILFRAVWKVQKRLYIYTSYLPCGYITTSLRNSVTFLVGSVLTASKLYAVQPTMIPSMPQPIVSRDRVSNSMR